MANPTRSESVVPISRLQLRRKGAELIENGLTRAAVVALAGMPDEESDERMLWKVGFSGADQLYFVVEFDKDDKVSRAYRPIP